MTTYILVMEVAKVKRFLFWKRELMVTSSAQVVESETDDLAMAISRQIVARLNGISEYKYSIGTLTPVNKLRVSQEDYKTRGYVNPTKVV
jgi:hypothetical protein